MNRFKRLRMRFRRWILDNGPVFKVRVDKGFVKIDES